MLDPYKIREQFPMFTNKIKIQGHDLVFLDNASTTFKPKCVLDAVERYYCFETSNSHRGDYDLSFNVDQKVIETRKLVAELINAKPEECIFTSGTTASLNIIAYAYASNNLKKDDEILISLEEHASNTLPWFEISKKTGCRIKYVELDNEGRITLENVKKAISKKTKLVSLAQVSNVLGYEIDIKGIAKAVHEVGALMSCDGAQSVPHMKVDVKDLDVDFLSFSAHKMCGPTGIGILYVKEEILNKLDNVFVGGGNNVNFSPEANVNYLKGPSRFEAGTLNVEGIFGFNAALKFIKEIGLKNIYEYEQNLRKYAVNRLKEVEGLTLYNATAEAGILTFNLKGVFAQDLGTYLNAKGIAVRTGLHCAKMLLLFTHEPATVRASIYFYTTKEEIDYLVDTLKTGGNFLDAYFA